VKPDDEILRPADYEFYRIVQKWESPRQARTPEQLTLDANKAHDNIKVLVMERDRLQEALLAVNEELEKARKWQRWLVSALVLTWTSWAAVVWWASKVLAPIVIKGLAKPM
jgi:hypothetical protein